MIQVTAHMRIWIAIEPADFRKGIDGLARVCREALAKDPFSGAVFVFRNRGSTALKILVYDGQGFWLCQKRMSKGRFGWWPDERATSVSLEPHELHVLLSGGDPSGAKGAPPWRRLPLPA